MSEGLRIARDVQRRQAALVENARQTRQRRREILENNELTPGARENLLAQLQRDSLATAKKLDGEIKTLQSEGAQWESHVRVTRPVDTVEQARVRRLLDEGVAPQKVLERGRELGHPELVAALRSEMLTFGDRHGFADTLAFVRDCDRVLADIGIGEEAAVNRGLVAFAEAAVPAKPVTDYAVKVSMGQETPYDILSMAYATGQGTASDDA
jgi:hypothetical protein